MDQILIGQFIARKRKEKNLTQEQLSEILNVSNKTVSKWECGKCMPDYSIVEQLCKELNISVSELLNGSENADPTSISSAENDQIMKLAEDIQNLKNDKTIPKTYVSAIILAIMGIAISLLSTLFGGSAAQDFISGFLIGIAITLILLSVFLITFATVCVIKKNRHR